MDLTMDDYHDQNGVGIMKYIDAQNYPNGRYMMTILNGKDLG